MSKLSRWLFVFIVVLVADLYLARGYWEMGGEIARLQTQLDRVGDVASKVAILQKDVQAQESELAAAEARLSTSEALFRVKANALEVVNLVVTSAQASGVELYTVQELPKATEKLVNSTYELGKYKVVAEGQLSYLAGLLDKIEAQTKATWRIDAVSFTPVTTVAGSVGNVWKLEFNILTLARLEQGG